MRERIGLAGQYAAVDENLTGFENLEMVGRLYHLGRRRGTRARARVARGFDLADAGSRLVRTYSGGMRRRLDLAAALVARPPVLFLDEPTTGLDPRSRNALWETIEGLVARGATVLLTTQYLDEADRLADQLAVIDHGTGDRGGNAGGVEGPDAAASGSRYGSPTGDARASERCALAPLSSGEPVERWTRRSSLPLRERRGAVAEAVRRLDEAGVVVDDLAVDSPTLDDVFLQLTGHVAEDDEEEQRE